MNGIQVLLFGPELPAAGQRVHCLIAQDTLHIRSLEAVNLQTIKLVELQASVAGFEHDQLQLSWRHEGLATWSLIPADAREQKKLIAALPLNVISGMPQWKRSTQSQNRVWKGILYMLGFFALALGISIWQNDRIMAWAASLVSMKTEKSLGESVLKSLNPETNFLNEGEAVKTVREIGQRLTAGSLYQYQWYVSKNQAVNAFAIPGGIVVVNSGLLKLADSPDELAAVLAHEVQHVEQRHALKNMLSSAAAATVVLVVLGDANAVVMMMAHQASTHYFSRQVESDADIKGVQLLQSKNIDANGMVSFFKKMDAGFSKKGKGTGEQTEERPSEVAGWFSSHPDTLIRIKAIEEYIARHPCNTCTKSVWDKIALQAELEKINKK